MSEILTDRVLTPEDFLLCCTEEDIRLAHGHNLIDEIHNALKVRGLENDTDNTIWDYPLSEIATTEECRDFVLVDVSRRDLVGQSIKEYRWFEVPDGFDIMRMLNRAVSNNNLGLSKDFANKLKESISNVSLEATRMGKILMNSSRIRELSSVSLYEFTNECKSEISDLSEEIMNLSGFNDVQK